MLTYKDKSVKGLHVVGKKKTKKTFQIRVTY